MKYIRATVKFTNPMNTKQIKILKCKAISTTNQFSSSYQYIIHYPKKWRGKVLFNYEGLIEMGIRGWRWRTIGKWSKEIDEIT